MKKRVLLVVVGIITLSAVLAWVAPNAGAVSSNLTCYKDDKAPSLTYDEWSRFIKISIPIPGLTHKLYCYEETQTTKVLKDSYYYTESLGDYLANFYQYFVSIVGILGATMILYGGIRWILAAGNQSRIQGAKNVIFSAIIGIVIAFGSYLLLFLLNPRLIDYSTLQSHLTNITGIAQSSEFCVDFEKNDTEDQFSYYVLSGEVVGHILNSSEELGQLDCGDEAAILDAGTAAAVTTNIGGVNKVKETQVSTCRGTSCLAPFQKCFRKDAVSEDYECRSSYLYGDISFEGNAYIDFMWMGARCNDGTGVQTNYTLDNVITIVTGGDFHYEELPIIDVDEGAQQYSFPTNRFSNGIDYDRERINDAINDCSSHGGFGGFYLQVEVNDDTSWGSTNDDDFVVGRNCRPLSTKDPAKISNDEWVQYLSALIQPEDFMEELPAGSGEWEMSGSYRCNFNIVRSQFPAR